jgi:hypothetical protein
LAVEELDEVISVSCYAIKRKCIFYWGSRFPWLYCWFSCTCFKRLQSLIIIKVLELYDFLYWDNSNIPDFCFKHICIRRVQK